ANLADFRSVLLGLMLQRLVRRLWDPVSGATAMAETLKLGVIVGLGENVAESFRLVHELGVPTCQLACWNPPILTPELAKKVVEASKQLNVEVSSFWAGHSGMAVWNFLEGPSTIGLVPKRTRAQRLEELKRGADFAKMIGAPSITTHVGFIPENPTDAEYP